MKIIKSGKRDRKLHGTCLCGCSVECDISETKEMVDRDSPEGARYVKCPECGNKFLWVSQ